MTFYNSKTVAIDKSAKRSFSSEDSIPLYVLQKK